jgi:hypothetical protein
VEGGRRAGGGREEGGRRVGRGGKQNFDFFKGDDWELGEPAFDSMISLVALLQNANKLSNSGKAALALALFGMLTNHPPSRSPSPSVVSLALPSAPLLALPRHRASSPSLYPS